MRPVSRWFECPKCQSKQDATNQVCVFCNIPVDLSLYDYGFDLDFISEEYWDEVSKQSRPAHPTHARCISQQHCPREWFYKWAAFWHLQGFADVPALRQRQRQSAHGQRQSARHVENSHDDDDDDDSLVTRDEIMQVATNLFSEGVLDETYVLELRRKYIEIPDSNQNEDEQWGDHDFVGPSIGLDAKCKMHLRQFDLLLYACRVDRVLHPKNQHDFLMWCIALYSTLVPDVIGIIGAYYEP